jgi:hypothetical protein
MEFKNQHLIDEIQEYQEKENVLNNKYKQAKNEYSSGKCLTVKEEKYTDVCGSSCTKYTNKSGGNLVSFCTGGNYQCKTKLYLGAQKLKELEQPKYTHSCTDIEIGIRGDGTAGKKLKSLYIKDPSITAEQYCKNTKRLGEYLYNQCLDDDRCTAEFAAYIEMIIGRHNFSLEQVQKFINTNDLKG